MNKQTFFEYKKADIFEKNNAISYRAPVVAAAMEIVCSSLTHEKNHEDAKEERHAVLLHPFSVLNYELFLAQ